MAHTTYVLTVALLCLTPAVLGQHPRDPPGSISGDRNVDDILWRNKCWCPCKPSAQKEYYIPTLQKSDWFGAVSYCANVGMEIAEVLNLAELDALRETINEEEQDPEEEFYWIGANDLGNQTVYRWALTGRPVEPEVTNWDKGEPNNVRESDNSPMEHCAAVNKETQKWIDFQCSVTKKFACQRFRVD
ncbi:CD209 antigen-like [Anopheles bellator]|uniref:CD209 antigen-like n=1 Tax=Anopheles bellator TaxID=139047 RepID=UPI002647CC6F|nr:CD209 antigen-like [Anopheles bellator]